ncbi:MAG: nucleotidyltransferase domain-containing protein [Nitrososphaeraceae archaeon]|jgi:predicted nucleotidyltransferase|nr:nucleotidyltransferase domain-containing protein [Nitrososphaeraceae archaeon]
MINSKDIIRIAERYRLTLIYLFGSKARGRDTELSDIDIAILLENEKKFNLRETILNLIFEFAQAFHSDKIDLLILNKAGLDIQYNVVCEGKILYQLNENIRCNYETQVIKLYLDFQKYETEYYALMHKAILQGRMAY